MHILMKFQDGPLHGIQEFTDSGRIDGNPTMAKALYQSTNGQVGNVMTSLGQTYRIIERTEDSIDNTIEIIAEYLPPESM